MTERMPESEQERQPGGGGMSWQAFLFYLAVLLTLTTCYLGKIQALPWQ